jgi:hypothetical protein
MARLKKHLATAWLVLAASAAVWFPQNASALILAEYDIHNRLNQATVGAVNVVSGITAANLSASTGLNVITGVSGAYVAQGWGTGPAPDPGRYYEWALTPDLNTAIEYGTLSYAVLRGQTWGGHGADLWSLYASTDDFTTAGVLLHTADISPAAAGEQVAFASVDISSLGWQLGAVTFRLYGYDYTSPVDFSGLANMTVPNMYGVTGTGSNVVLQGNVKAVPEPSTVALVLLALMLFTPYFLRQKRAET